VIRSSVPKETMTAEQLVSTYKSLAPAARSKSAREKDATHRTASGLPVQSFQDLLKDLATLNRNTVRLESSGAEFNQQTEATPLQRRVFELLATPS
jgi:hypothetical protein